MKKIDLQAEAIQGVISFCDGVWILKYQNEFEERASRKKQHQNGVCPFWI